MHHGTIFVLFIIYFIIILEYDMHSCVSSVLIVEPDFILSTLYSIKLGNLIYNI